MENTICPICLEEINISGEKLPPLSILGCGHIYHNHCFNFAYPQTERQFDEGIFKCFVCKKIIKKLEYDSLGKLREILEKYGIKFTELPIVETNDTTKIVSHKIKIDNEKLHEYFPKVEDCIVCLEPIIEKECCIFKECKHKIHHDCLTKACAQCTEENAKIIQNLVTGNIKAGRYDEILYQVCPLCNLPRELIINVDLDAQNKRKQAEEKQILEMKKRMMTKLQMDKWKKQIYEYDIFRHDGHIYGICGMCGYQDMYSDVHRIKKQYDKYCSNVHVFNYGCIDGYYERKRIDGCEYPRCPHFQHCENRMEEVPPLDLSNIDYKLIEWDRY